VCLTMAEAGARGGRSRRQVTVDRLFAVGLTLLQVAGPTTGGREQAAPAGWTALVGLVLAGVQGIALLWRRRRPVAVLMVSGAGYVAHALLVDPVPPYAAWAALYAVAVYASLRRTAVVAAAAAVALQAATLALLVVHGDIVADDLPLPVLVSVVVTLAAFLVRDRRAFRVRERQTLVREAAAGERLRIARELHDLVGHGLSTIAIQSSTGRVALDAGKVPEARGALAAVEETSRSALREVRVLLGVLRDADSDRPHSPLPGLRDVARLAAGVRSADLDVRLDLAGDLDGVPQALGVTAYRVVQEALTNVVRHAAAREAVVHIDVRGDAVLVEVADNGQGARAGDGGGQGHGLVGMRERVEAYGGELTAGPVPSRAGWLVQARLPLPPGVTT
jgi:signal transduction histidine kinase